MSHSDPKEAIKAELEDNRSRFHSTLNTLSRENWYKTSLFSGWTNGQVLFHMTLGFLILPTLVTITLLFDRFPKSCSKIFSGLLNAGTRPFIWIDVLGPRVGAKIFSQASLGRKYDKAHASVLKKVQSLRESDWKRGMYCPTRWDPLMKEFMTVEDLFHYMTAHFNHHLNQLSG